MKERIVVEYGEVNKIAELMGCTNVMVSHVLGKSPAGRAGLRAFDIVKSLNGEEILGVNRLQQLIARLKPGEPAELTVVRGAQTLTLTVTPTARPKNAREREKAGPAAINTI